MGNREYKSDVFCMLLEDKKNALALYNAINGSNHTNPEMVEICTLEGGISLTIRNDSAFVIDFYLNMFEHQSTVCPNMPMRNLTYVTPMLENMLKDKNLLGSKLIKIPTPRFVVFYNGREKQPEKYELKLSEAYERPTERPELELVCTVYNINKGYNKELLGNCIFLKEYMQFIECVQLYVDMYGKQKLTLALKTAIDECIENNILRDFLIERRSEVEKIMRLDYTFDRQIELEKRDSFEEGLSLGREEGLTVGREEGMSVGQTKQLIFQIIEKIKKGKSISQISDELETDISIIETIYNVAVKYSPDYDADNILEEFL